MSTAQLAKKRCEPCKGGVPPLKGAELEKYKTDLDANWECVDGHHLEKTYKVDGYDPAVQFANAVADIAREQDHHPDVLFSWGKVTVTIYTHKIDGLTPSDFYFAAKCEEAFKGL